MSRLLQYLKYKLINSTNDLNKDISKLLYLTVVMKYFPWFATSDMLAASSLIPVP